jgi:protein involved in polysaccharide export with SLBB domain
MIWREDDLSGEFVVDHAGFVTLPLLGEVHVEGIAFDQLRDTLLSGYRQELRNPSIVITPLRRVFVLGEVNEPGFRTVDPTISLAGVVALAGGANPQGDLRKIRVYREGELILNGVPASNILANLDIQSGDQIFVGQRSWFERNSTFIISALLSATSIIITLAR